TPSPAPAAPAEHDATQILAEMRRLAGELEYDRVLALGRRLLLRGDLSIDERAEGLLLLGSVLVYIGDPSSAEVFDELLRLRPDFEVPPSSERKVSVAIADAQRRSRDVAASARQAYVRNMVIEAPDALRVSAGDPLVFEFNIRDPGRHVREARVKYRLR